MSEPEQSEPRMPLGLWVLREHALPKGRLWWSGIGDLKITGEDEQGRLIVEPLRGDESSSTNGQEADSSSSSRRGRWRRAVRKLLQRS